MPARIVRVGLVRVTTWADSMAASPSTTTLPCPDVRATPWARPPTGCERASTTAPNVSGDPSTANAAPMASRSGPDGASRAVSLSLISTVAPGGTPSD